MGIRLGLGRVRVIKVKFRVKVRVRVRRNVVIHNIVSSSFEKRSQSQRLLLLVQD